MSRAINQLESLAGVVRLRDSVIRARLFDLALAVVCVCAASSTPGFTQTFAQIAATPEKRMPVVGISTHFAQGQGDPSTHIRRMKQNGWRALRDEAFWSHTESSVGHFLVPRAIQDTLAVARQHGMTTTLLLGYGHPVHTRGFKPTTDEQRTAFAKYARFIAEQTKDLVDTLEIWNEWDIDIGGGVDGKPEDYIALLREVVPVIRKAAPKVKIIGGSLTPEGVDRGYLRALVNLGLLDWIDGVSVHAYVWSRSANTPQDAANWVSSNLGYTRGKPIYVTEIGWPTHSSFFQRRGGISELTQQDYVCKTVSLMAAIPSVKSIYFYGLLDSGTDSGNPEHRFGLIRRDGESRPAFVLKACPI